MIIDFERVLARHQDKANQQISRDYFLYQALQYEKCLSVKNSKKFVFIPPWRTDTADANFKSMTDWYTHNCPILKTNDKLLPSSLYFHLPAFMSYIEEAQKLWQEQHQQATGSFKHNDPFWQKLLSCISESFSYKSILTYYLQWRYGERQKYTIPPENMPPNPFAERRFPRNRHHRQTRSNRR